VRDNGSVDLLISSLDMESLKATGGADNGKASAFPVFGKKATGRDL
jgi:hypothetical protein